MDLSEIIGILSFELRLSPVLLQYSITSFFATELLIMIFSGWSNIKFKPPRGGFLLAFVCGLFTWRFVFGHAVGGFGNYARSIFDGLSAARKVITAKNIVKTFFVGRKFCAIGDFELPGNPLKLAGDDVGISDAVLVSRGHDDLQLVRLVSSLLPMSLLYAMLAYIQGLFHLFEIYFLHGNEPQSLPVPICREGKGNATSDDKTSRLQAPH